MLPLVISLGSFAFLGSQLYCLNKYDHMWCWEAHLCNRDTGGTCGRFWSCATNATCVGGTCFCSVGLCAVDGACLQHGVVLPYKDKSHILLALAVILLTQILICMGCRLSSKRTGGKDRDLSLPQKQIEDTAAEGAAAVARVENLKRMHEARRAAEQADEAWKRLNDTRCLTRRMVEQAEEALKEEKARRIKADYDLQSLSSSKKEVEDARKDEKERRPDYETRMKEMTPRVEEATVPESASIAIDKENTLVAALSSCANESKQATVQEVTSAQAKAPAQQPCATASFWKLPFPALDADAEECTIELRVDDADALHTIDGQMWAACKEKGLDPRTLPSTMQMVFCNGETFRGAASEVHQQMEQRFPEGMVSITNELMPLNITMTFCDLDLASKKAKRKAAEEAAAMTNPFMSEEEVKRKAAEYTPRCFEVSFDLYGSDSED